MSELERIHDALVDVRFDMCPMWGRTRLLCNPDMAKALCEMVRLRTKLARWTDELILLSLFPAKQRPRRRT